MGQATVDLPDQPDPAAVEAAAPPPTSLSSADDLLAQLAGEEIDRLLAEADAERPPIANRPLASAQAVLAPAPQATATLAVPASPAAPATANPPTIDVPVIAQDLDALFDELTTARPADASPTPTVAGAASNAVAGTSPPAVSEKPTCFA